MDRIINPVDLVDGYGEGFLATLDAFVTGLFQI
jgi:hypothetical protein